MAAIDHFPGDRRSGPSPNGLPQHFAILASTGEYWTVSHDGVAFSLKDVKGLSYLRRLLTHPDREFHALELLSEGDSAEQVGASGLKSPELAIGRLGDAGEMLDARAKRDYRRRLLELREEIADLRERGDHERAEKVQTETDFIAREIARAVGLGGRDRRAGSTAERARLNVTRAIKFALRKISEHNGALGEFLTSRIRTGAFCSFSPGADANVVWRFELESTPEAPLSPQKAGNSIRAPAYRTGFVGREEERALLRECMRRAKNGEGQVAIVAGSPGIGKTRIAREAGNEARHQGFVTLAGNCYDRDDSVPFMPFVEALETALAPLASPEEIRKVLGEQSAEIARLLPKLYRLFPELPAPLPVSPEQSRRLLFNAVAELFARHCARAPIVLLLEDLHWADEGTLSLLIHLGRAAATMPLLIVATHRDDPIDLKAPLTKALDELVRLCAAERIQLHGLSPGAVAQMIELLSGREPTGALVDLIYANSEGNPLFVEELMRHLERSHTAGGPQLEPGEIELPDNLRLAIRRRLRMVGVETAKVLGTAAAIGRSFTFALLEAATHADSDKLVDAIEEAEMAGLITSKPQFPDERFKFTHELIRRAAVDELSGLRRQRLHLNIAEAIERMHPGFAEDYAEDLAHHFWRAGSAANPSKAIHYLQIAGERAMRSSADEAAIAHFRRALQLIETLSESPERLRLELSLQISLGAALTATKGFSSPEVEETYNRARRLCELAGEAPQLFPTLSGLWMVYTSRGEHSTARDLAQQCFRIARSAGDCGFLAHAHHLLGTGFIVSGDLALAKDNLERALEHYNPRRHQSLIYTFGHDTAAVALVQIGWPLWLLGYPDQALTRCRQGRELAQQLNHPYTSLTVAAFAAWVYQFIRDSQTVEELATETISISTDYGFAFYRAYGLVMRGWALTEQGRVADGIAQMRAGLDEYGIIGGGSIKPSFLCLLAEAYGRLGSFDRALDVLAEARDLAEKSGERWWLAELHRLRGELILGRAGASPPSLDNQVAAERCFDEAVRVARAQNAKSLELRATMSLCRLRSLQLEHDRACGPLKEILGAFDEGYQTPDLTEAALLLKSSCVAS